MKINAAQRAVRVILVGVLIAGVGGLSGCAKWKERRAERRAARAAKAADRSMTLDGKFDDWPADAATVATITAGIDGADGLFVEKLYPDCVEAIRWRGGKLCEFTKFAVDESVRSQAVIGAIFHVACLYVLEVHRCTDALIEVNPRHVRFYEQMLGFSRAAEQRLDHSVSAPAVLMRLDLSHCAREIERLAGSGAPSRRERSFYPHFFSRPVAEEVVQRLRVH